MGTRQFIWIPFLFLSHVYVLYQSVSRMLNVCKEGYGGDKATQLRETWASFYAILFYLVSRLVWTCHVDSIWFFDLALCFLWTASLFITR